MGGLKTETSIAYADARARSILKRVADLESPRVAELGVFTGMLSMRLLVGHPKLHLTMVDAWEADGGSYADKTNDYHAQLTDEEQMAYMHTALIRTDFAGDRHVAIRGRSADVGEGIEDLFDLVFIDADHSFEGCKKDIKAWTARVKPGGWLSGHDYNHPRFPGVKVAVDAFAEGKTLELDENYTWFVKL